MEDASVTTIVLVSGAVGGVLTGLGAVIVNLLKARAAINKEARADAMSELWKINESQQRQITQQQTQLAEQAVAIGFHTEQIVDILKREADCLQREGDLKLTCEHNVGEVAVLKESVRRLQVLTHDTLPFSMTPVIITASATDGIIHYANGPTGVLLGWPQNDLVGQSIDILIPPDMPEALEKHKQGLKAVMEGKSVNRTHNMIAWKGDKTKVAVEISLKNWTTPTGLAMVTADIRPDQSLNPQKATGNSGVFKKNK